VTQPGRDKHQTGCLAGETLDRPLTWFKHPICNATSEAYNSRIQWVKSSARGF
jgi:hypothetical protein